MFGKPKPTVTPDDRRWIEEAFIWFEKQDGKEYLKSVRIIEPTSEFFDRKFSGNEDDAEFLLNKTADYMEIKSVNIDLHFYSEAPMEFDDEATTATLDNEGTEMNDIYTLGNYSETGSNRFEIGLERSQLNSPQSMVATIAHELSHLILLGEGRLEENDEELTDLNCIALGFGIFIGNSIFSFQQWQGISHQGWQANRKGYIPEEVAAYAMALFNNYQNNSTNWPRHLNKSMSKFYLKNLKYLQKTKDEILFV